MAVLWRVIGLSSLMTTGSLFFRTEFAREDAGDGEADDNGDSLDDELSSSDFGGFGHGFSASGAGNLFANAPPKLPASIRVSSFGAISNL
ncbi:hypothetical protein KJ359_004404 [Pestalotiopsis sp. 9143b]|nr:hypothetical protein KJ359_004404 [Pestalotiopsis sp. 9143b]